MSPQQRFHELYQHAAAGLTVEQTAARMNVPTQLVYAAKQLLGLPFRNASIGNRSGVGRKAAS